jgi:hypothetical protein
MAHQIMLVMTEAVAGMEDEYNEWYTNVHVPEVLRVPGVEAAQRFVADSSQEGAAAHPRKYLTIYEYSLDRKQVEDGIRAAHASGEMSDVSKAIDRDLTITYLYTPLTERTEA